MRTKHTRPRPRTQRASASLGIVCALLIGGLTTGCQNSGAELDELLTTASKAAQSTTLTSTTFIATDDGANRTTLCTIIDRDGDVGRSRSWFDGTETKDGCTGTEQLAYEALITPGQVYSRDVNATAPPAFSMALADKKLTAELNTEMTDPIIDVTELPKVIEAAGTTRKLDDSSAGGPSFEVKASFEAMHAVLGKISDGGGIDYQGLLRLSFDKQNRLATMKYTADDEGQAFEFKSTWKYEVDNATFAVPEPENVHVLDSPLTAMELLRSFIGSTGTE